MRFQLEFEPVPDSCTSDPRTSIGPNYRSAIVRLYATVMINMIKRTLPPPEGVTLSIKSSLMSGECNIEIVAKCDDTNVAALEWVYDLESNFPESFDSVAEAEFKLAEGSLDPDAMGWEE